MLDLLRPEHAYFFGFAQADGSLTRYAGRKGRLSIELGLRDMELLERLAEVVPCRATLRTRTRDTNFKRGHAAAVLDVHDAAFRETLVHLGLPEGAKSTKIAPPTVPFSWRDYFRGLIDADGSIGFDRSGRPFLSLCTSSVAMATAFSALVEDLTLHRIGIRPNARDGAYNVMCWMERAQEVVAFMYYPGALSLARKAARADRVLAWTRPPDLPRVAPRRPWTAHEDELFERMSNAEVVARTRRSPASVAQRRKTLRKRDGSST